MFMGLSNLSEIMATFSTSICQTINYLFFSSILFQMREAQKKSEGVLKWIIFIYQTFI